MTSQFEGYNPGYSADESDCDNSELDSFELLSAYIDGELSASQIRQVQVRIDCDPQFKKLYRQLSTLQSQMQHSVAPPSSKSTEEITAGVFQSLDRTSRWRRKLVLSSGAIAASVVAGFAGLVPGFSPLSPRIAEHSTPKMASPVMLAVALDRPAIDIPKTVGDWESEGVSD